MFIKRKFLGRLGASLALSGAIALVAQTSSPATTQSIDAQQIPIYGSDTPGTFANEYRSPISMPGGGDLVRNVSRPVLIPVLPKPGKANGTALIVVPGGAFIGLAIDLEGFQIAHALAEHGITAFVLKYRLVPTSADGHDIGKAATDVNAKGTQNPDASFEERQYPPALEDSVASVALVRRNASQWRIDPKRVGMIGFSAGAITVMNTALRKQSADRPDFVGYIYGPEVDVAAPVDAPPLFVAIALNDQLFRSRGFPTVEAWEKAKRPVELHAYQKGAHGFGSGIPGTTTTLILEEFTAWLEMNDFLKPTSLPSLP